MDNDDIRIVVQRGYSATVYLALGHLSMGVGGDTIAQARDNAARYAEQHHALRPSAVCVHTTRGNHWFGWTGKRWRKGGWCFGCDAWSPRKELAAYCEGCGDSLWNNPLDPGWAFPKFYWAKWRQT